MRIIEIASGKKKLEFVAGLIWHPLGSHATGAARTKEILRFAEVGGADFKVIRGDDSPHVGLAKKADGAKAGQISAAAVIADSLSGNGSRNMLVAMALPDDSSVYVYVAVRDGVILADGDAVGTEDEIRVRLVGDVSFGGWDRVICPGEWGVLDSEERALESFFTPEVLKSHKQWHLLETKKAFFKSAFPVLVLVAVAGASTYGWQYWQHKKALAAEILRIQQEAEIARGQRVTPAEPPKPWLQLPDAKSFTQACTNARQKTELAAGNWAIENVVCEGGLLTVTWKKANENAWISHLKATHPNATVSDDGERAFLRVPAAVASINASQSVLPNSKGLANRFYDLASRYGLALRMESQTLPPAPPVLPGQAASPVLPPTWASMGFTVTASYNPNEVVSVLDYPGFRVSKIVYVLRAGVIQYQLTGVQYVRL